ncbi:MAG: hypothetical protein ACO3A4_04200 [Silvanigrellaceae bacterium]
MLVSVLEKYLSEVTVREFKHDSMKFFTHIAVHFFKCCPQLEKAGHIVHLHDSVSLMTGLHPLTNPSPPQLRGSRMILS